MQQQEDYTCDLTKLPTGSELRKEVASIRQMGQSGKSIDDIRATHTEFCKRYPKLVDKLIEPNMNEEQLEYILGMFEQVQQRKTPFEQASQVVGKSMFDKFVAPDLTPEQRQRVEKRMEVLKTQSPEELAQAAAQLGQSSVSGLPGGASASAPAPAPARTNRSGGNKKKLRKRRENDDSSVN